MTTAMAHARQMQDKLREESRTYETLAEGAWTTTTTRRAKERERDASDFFVGWEEDEEDDDGRVRD